LDGSVSDLRSIFVDVNVMDDAWMRIQNRSDPTTTRVNIYYLDGNGRICRTSAGTGMEGTTSFINRILVVTSNICLVILQIVDGMFDEIFGGGGGGEVKYCS
jgi:hypothetical protein